MPLDWSSPRAHLTKGSLSWLGSLTTELTGTIGEDQRRAEVAAIPLVCVVLFFVFGGVVAAALPGIIGGLTIAGALGIMRLIAEFIPVGPRPTDAERRTLSELARRIVERFFTIATQEAR